MIAPRSSGKAYIEFITKTSIPTTINIDSMNRLWDDWEKKGVHPPKNLRNILNDPDFVLRQSTEEITALIAKQFGRAVRNPSFAFTLFSDFNSYATTVDNGDWVIVLDRGLDNFFTLFNVIACSCAFSRPSQTEIDLHCECLKTVFNYFMRKSKAAESEMHSRFLAIAAKDYELTEWGAQISRAMSTYMVCHEMAHHYLGHTGEERELPMLEQMSENHKATAQFHAWRDEYEADAEGMNLYHDLITHVSKMEWARINEQIDRIPFLLFVLFDLYEKHKECFGSSVLHDSHPSPSARWNNLASHLFRRSDKAQLSGARQATYSLSREGRAVYGGIREFVDEYISYIRQLAREKIHHDVCQ